MGKFTIKPPKCPNPDNTRLDLSGTWDIWGEDLKELQENLTIHLPILRDRTHPPLLPNGGFNEEFRLRVNAMTKESEGDDRLAISSNAKVISFRGKKFLTWLIQDAGGRDFGVWDNKSAGVYNISFQIDVNRRILELLEDPSRQTPVRVFEAGCGPGRVLKDIKHFFEARGLGDKVETIGLVYARTSKEKYEGVDELMVGDILEVEPTKKFDIVLSHSGALHHTSDTIGALRRTVSWMNPGALAMVKITSHRFGIPDSSDMPKAVKALRDLGISNPIYDPYCVFIFEKPPLKKGA